MMRKLFTLLVLCPFLLMAQKPFISSISPTRIEVGQNINISGSNLGNVDEVFFGGVKGTVVSASANLVIATVPAGATNSSIRVQTTGNLVAESSERFFISFSGNSSPTFGAEFLEAGTETDAYDICLCDLNNDDLNDIIISHNSASGTEASILENQSTFSTESFNEIAFINNPINNNGFISTTCADLDNDGDKDIIFTTNDGTNVEQIFLYENTNPGTFTLTFDTDVQLSLPTDGGGNNRVPRRVKAADIDGDGKLDLVVGNENDATIHIFPNTSTPGNFSFGTTVEIAVGSALTTGAIDLGDFNNDGKPDVVVVPAAQSNQPIFILKNQSLSGSISFSLSAGISTQDQRRNVVIGDFDNDGFNDIATTADRTIGSTSGSEAVEVFRNTSTGSGGDITFAVAESITIPSNLPWGLDAGDLNGDGLLDIAVACVGGNVYTIENNNSTPGTISFNAPVEQSTSNNARNVCIGDLDQDARPDLAYTHNVSLSQVGDLGVRLNETCIVPVITPNNLEFCYDEFFTLEATKTAPGIGATYAWVIEGPATGTITTPAADNTPIEIDAGSPSPSTVRVTLTLAGCSEQGTADFTLLGGIVPATPTFASPSDLVCFGEDITISASAGSFTEYEWTLPDGSKTTTTGGDLVITNATLDDAGTYTVRAKETGTCFSNESTTFSLEVSQPPLLEIINNDLDDFCAGTNITLEVSDFRSDGFTYQWQRDNSDFGAGDVASVSVNQEGNYTVEVTDVNTCVTETAQYFINSVDEPTSVANGPTETCENFLTSFTSASTGEAGFTLQYEWVVNDGSTDIHTATTQDLDFTFPSTGSYTVTHNTSYPNTEVYAGGGSNICESSDVINVTVSAAPSMMFSTADRLEKCQAETASVEIQNTGVSTYSWTLRNAAASPNDTIIITSAGTSSILDVSTPIGVDSVYAVASITTNIGCTVLDSVKVVNFPSLVDIELSDFTTPDQVTLDEDNFVSLTALNVTNVRWRPNEIMSDSTSQTVTVFPNQPSTFVTLFGTDDNDCAVSSQIEIILDNLRPKRTFSPNGDGLNDCWEILNSSQDNTTGCKAYVFDARGRNIFVGDAPFENNCVWDGNFNGSPVPEGLYYFVLKCDNNLTSKSGSILLAR